MQRCSLLSIKTGGCSEDCAYCAQSAHYSTGIEREDLLSVGQIVDVAKRARAQGATRFCMGAAWRGLRDGTEKFERVLEIVREVGALGMEVCVTLGEIGPAEARKLKAAGVTAYNHNIDTSRSFIRTSLARTLFRTGSIQSPLCKRAGCRFAPAESSGWANQKRTDCE